LKTTISSKGQVVLPAEVRRRLGLLPGTEMSVEVQEDQVILEIIGSMPPKFRQGKSPVSGMPVLEITKNRSVLTSEQVEELLMDFP